MGPSVTNKTLTVLRLAVLIGVFPISSVGAPAPPRQSLLRDGFVLSGVDGRLTPPDSNEATDKWFFEFGVAVSDDIGTVPAGASLQLLPSSALERMIADVNERPDPSYRLWARVTRYKGRNFVFPVYFLPLGKVEPLQQPPWHEPSPPTEPAVNEPNDTLAIPKEVLDKLKTEAAIRPKPAQKLLELKQDFVLVDRTAVLVKQADGRLVFVPDALGRGLRQVSFRLLPCQALELTERRYSAEPDRMRFKIAGIVTQYKGKRYLLLQKATRLYSCGNFGL
jgi:hypothetical protein